MSDHESDRESVSEDELVEKLQTLGVPIYHTIHRGDPFNTNPQLPAVCREQYGCFEEILKDMTPIVTERIGCPLYYSPHLPSLLKLTHNIFYTINTISHLLMSTDKISPFDIHIL